MVHEIGAVLEARRKPGDVLVDRIEPTIARPWHPVADPRSHGRGARNGIEGERESARAQRAFGVGDAGVPVEDRKQRVFVDCFLHARRAGQP